MRAPAFDVEFAEKLEALSAMGEDLLATAVEMFCAQAAALVERIDIAVATQDRARLGGAARALAELGSGVGAVGLEEIARRLLRAEPEAWAYLSWLVTDAERECQRACAALRALCEG